MSARIAAPRCHTMAELLEWRLAVACPACGAPAGAPCADRRSYDRDLYGARVHPARRRARLAAAALIAERFPPLKELEVESPYAEAREAAQAHVDDQHLVQAIHQYEQAVA